MSDLAEALASLEAAARADLAAAADAAALEAARQYNSIMTKALADRLAEAFAECLHQRARAEWG